MIVESNVKKLHKVQKKLFKVFQFFRNPKKGGHKQFFKNAPENIFNIMPFSKTSLQPFFENVSKNF